MKHMAKKQVTKMISRHKWILMIYIGIFLVSTSTGICQDYSQPKEYIAYPQGGGQVLIVDAINGREVMLLQSTGGGNYIEAVYGLKTYRIARGQLIDAVYGKIIATLMWVSP